MTHLWEVRHPYYGCSYNRETFGGLAELREHVDGSDPDMNFIYRWDWADYSQPHYDDLFLDDGEDRSEQWLSVFVLMPRKDIVAEWRCPISHREEPAVLEWLSGPRVLGHLRAWWAPLLDSADMPGLTR